MAGVVEYTTSSDGELVGLARGGDESAFEELVCRHRKKVYGQILKMLSNPDEALDLSQDVWVKAWSRLYQFQGDSPFGTWITRIAINVCLDALRKKQRRPVEESLDAIEQAQAEGERDGSALPTVQEDPLAGMAREEVAGYLKEAMAGISEEQRTVLEYLYFDGLEYKEIAEKMNSSKGTVMSRIFYGKKALERQLKVLRERGIDLKDSL